MSFVEKLKVRLPKLETERVTKENISKYENIFYSNEDYYLITEGRPAVFSDCVETVEFTESFSTGNPHCVGFSKNDTAVAFLSMFEGYPEENTLYIGLFLVDKSFQRNSVGTDIISAVIGEGFDSGYTTVKLSVQDNNLSGYPFWKKLGFKAAGITECEGFFNVSMELINKS